MGGVEMDGDAEGRFAGRGCHGRAGSLGWEIRKKFMNGFKEI